MSGPLPAEVAIAARRAGVTLLALLCTASGLGGCRGIPYPEPSVEGEYGTALKNATRRASLIEGLETRAFVHLVYVTPELAALQADRLSAFRAEPPAEAAARRDRARAEVAAPTFFAIVFTPERNWNDWESKKSSWRIALDTPAGQSVPVSVQRFERPFGVELAKTYPFVDDFHVAYKLQFPAGVITQPPHLTVAGALGKMEFSWKED